MGVESANYYTPAKWLTFDADFATSQARYRGNPQGGDCVPEAANVVIASGVTVHDLWGFSSGLRLRYFGPRALTTERQCLLFRHHPALLHHRLQIQRNLVAFGRHIQPARFESRRHFVLLYFQASGRISLGSPGHPFSPGRAAFVPARDDGQILTKLPGAGDFALSDYALTDFTLSDSWFTDILITGPPAEAVASSEEFEIGLEFSDGPSNGCMSACWVEPLSMFCDSRTWSGLALAVLLHSVLMCLLWYSPKPHAQSYKCMEVQLVSMKGDANSTGLGLKVPGSREHRMHRAGSK